MGKIRETREEAETARRAEEMEGKKRGMGNTRALRLRLAMRKDTEHERRGEREVVSLQDERKGVEGGREVAERKQKEGGERTRTERKKRTREGLQRGRSRERQSTVGREIEKKKRTKGKTTEKKEKEGGEGKLHVLRPLLGLHLLLRLPLLPRSLRAPGDGEGGGEREKRGARG